MTDIRNLIVQGARRRHLDPQALLAVFKWEGLSGRIGDGGHAFGPGQENDAGGVLTGRFPGWSPQQKQAWAMSPAGINDLLNRVSHVASGRHGADAINAIVRRFERPANPDLEVRRATQSYGQVGGGVAGVSPSAPAAAQATAPSNINRHDLAMQLISTLGHDHPDVSALIPLVAAARVQPHVDARMQRRFAPPAGNVAAAPKRTGAGGINELFYDPLGAIKNGHPIAAIGGHNDHVHISLASEKAQRAAIAQARRMGLHVGQDTDQNVTQVHVADSYHYRHYRKGDPLRMAADVSGDAHRMAMFFKWVQRRYG